MQVPALINQSLRDAYMRMVCRHTCRWYVCVQTHLQGILKAASSHLFVLHLLIQLQVLLPHTLVLSQRHLQLLVQTNQLTLGTLHRLDVVSVLLLAARVSGEGGEEGGRRGDAR